MVVDEIQPDGGSRWHSTVGPWRLDHDNAIDEVARGTVVRFTAQLTGPGSAMLERVAGPLWARGQRRRVARLAEMAEVIDRRAGII